jgi:hypothetical protein
MGALRFFIIDKTVATGGMVTAAAAGMSSLASSAAVSLVSGLLDQT